MGSRRLCAVLPLVLLSLATSFGDERRNLWVPNEKVPPAPPGQIPLHVVQLEQAENEADSWGVLFRVHRPKFTAIGRPLPVLLYPKGETTEGQDFQRVPKQIVIPPGAWQIEIRIRFMDDNLAEGSESIWLEATMPESEIDPNWRER